MDHAELLDVVQPNLLLVQPANGSVFLAELRADAAQVHDGGESCGLDCPRNGGADPILVGQEITGGVIRRNHGKDSIDAPERSGEDIRIVKCAGVGNGALTHQAFQAIGAPSHDAHLVARS